MSVAVKHIFKKLKRKLRIIRYTMEDTIVCPADIVEGRLFTKEKRHEIFGHVAGGADSRKMEIYQRAKIEEGTRIPCPKTNMRINLRTNEMEEIAHPNKKDNGFDYTEDFDGCQTYKANTIYINMKSIVGKGGGQTRSLREVYSFVEGQLNYKKSREPNKIYFANIMDGDEAANTFAKFQYLINLPEFANIKKYVYVGDLKGYFTWLKDIQ